jgi:3-methyladenine DNA glycosylase/8-oxoguanine DNA glycosylase
VSWSELLELRGAGGEPVDFRRTVLSHGLADLPPNSIPEDGSRLETVLRVGEQAWLVSLEPEAEGRACLRVLRGRPSAAVGAEIQRQVRHMLRLDEDLSSFYAAAAADPGLAWAAAGAGRMLRSPTVFEDVVKTICTTNCAWSGTVRMVSALVGELGLPVAGAGDRRAFPDAAAMGPT